MQTMGTGVTGVMTSAAGRAGELRSVGCDFSVFVYVLIRTRIALGSWFCYNMGLGSRLAALLMV